MYFAMHFLFLYRNKMQALGPCGLEMQKYYDFKKEKVII